MHAWLVKTADGYLYPFGVDASFTDDPQQAEVFDSLEAARAAALDAGYLEEHVELVRADHAQSHRP